jgi:hypothetical protein
VAAVTDLTVMLKNDIIRDKDILLGRRIEEAPHFAMLFSDH